MLLELHRTLLRPEPCPPQLSLLPQHPMPPSHQHQFQPDLPQLTLSPSK